MFYAIIPVLLITISQTDALFTATMPPPDASTFEVTLEGKSPFYAGMRIGGSWITNHGSGIKPTQKVEFILDSPFYTAPSISVPMRRAQIKYEPPAMRRARLEQAWKDHGYTFLNTQSGWVTIKEEDITLAERARKMATPPENNVDIQFNAAPSSTEQSTTGILGARKMLLIRAAIIIAGFAVAGIALKFIFKKEAEWNSLE